jgi:hypothetical protein
MVLRLNISPRAEAALRRRAAELGVNVETYAERQIERLAAGELTLEELSGPAYEEFLASGMTDDELGQFLEDAKHEMRRNEDRA